MIPLLPRAEAEHLLELHQSSPLDFYLRIALLHHMGWSLRSIATSLEMPTSTIHFWVARTKIDTTILVDRPIPAPPYKKPKIPRIVSPVDYPSRALSLDVFHPDREEIVRLAPVARRYRAGSPPEGEYAQARRKLDFLVQQHSRRGVPISRLAELGGVTYRAMKTRIMDGLFR